MSTSLGQDAEILQNQAYADPGPLGVRYRTHQRFTVNPVDFGRWTLERLAWAGDERVLDIGCGRGDLLAAMARRHQGWGLLAGLDFSRGMVAQAAKLADELEVSFLEGDAKALPFPHQHFDVVMARHMLYHVPGIDRAVAGAARVLRAGGRFLATTNSSHSMPEYQEIRRRAAQRFAGMAQPEMVSGRFCLENGAAILAQRFASVGTYTLPGTLRFPSAQPFVEYFASSRALTMLPGHTDAEWLEVLDFVQAEAQATIAAEGHLDVSKLAGAFVAVKGD